MATKELKSCGKGHFYDDSEHSACPYCGVPIEIGETVGRPDLAGARPRGAGPQQEDVGRTRPAGEAVKGPRRDTGETVGYFKQKLGIDPVVGWLVCIAGPDKGRDYRIHAERNFIGRSETMDIVLAEDKSVSRENHAVVSYNPKRHTFSIAPGESRGLTYLNDQELLGALPLNPYDTIELGATKLLFVPFCGERFTWPVAGAVAVD